MMPDPSMSCDAVHAALPAYLANTLDEPSAEAIESHVSACAACESRLEHATRLDLDGLTATVPVALRARVLAAIPAAPARARRAIGWRAFTAVATLAAAAVLYVSTTRDERPTDPTPPVATAPSDGSAGDAMRSARALASEQAASEFRSLDAAAQELEQAIRSAPEDRDMRAYLDAVQARRAELAEKIAEAAS